MQVTKSSESPCSVVLEFEIDAETVSKAFDQAYKQLGRITVVPGFRPGKAPRAMLERYVSSDRARGRAAILLSSRAFTDALKQFELTPYTESARDGDDPVDGEPWKFSTRVFTAPRITLGETEGLAVERPVFAVEDADVDGEVEMVRRDYRRATPVEGRGLTAEDAAIADLEVMVEGVDDAPGKRRTLLTFGDNIPGFDEAVLGMTAGEERSFDLAYPEDHQDAERAGKPAHFTVRVDSIFRYELPELTDAWTANTLGVESVDALRTLIRERLERDARDRSDQETESRIVAELVRRSEVEYPEYLLDEEVQEERAQLERVLARSGMSFQDYLERANVTEEQAEEQMAARSDARLKSGLLLRELARREGVGVTKEEVDRTLEAMSDESPEAQRRLRRQQQDAETRAEVANRLLRGKLRQLLFGLAAIAEVPAPRQE